jgi:hypothetical protein
MSRGYSHEATPAAEEIPRRLRLLGLVLIGVVGAISITRVFVGSYPWQPAPNLEVTAWRTFDGVFLVTFGFVLTIGVALLIANVVGKGITCPRCGTWNPRRRAPARRASGDFVRAVSHEEAHPEPAPHGVPAV